MKHRERAAGAGRGRQHLVRGGRLLTALLVSSFVAGALFAGRAYADEGANLYKNLCASCHGMNGRGDGPAAGALTPPPTDLTKSTLNVAELMKVIDGRRTVRAHGDAAMPVWGTVIEQAMEGSGREHRDTLRQVQMLAQYVRSLAGTAAQ